MDVEIGTEAGQFPEKEYINGGFLLQCFAVSRRDFSASHCIFCGETFKWGQKVKIKRKQLFVKS
jgi:hypothetical protein